MAQNSAEKNGQVAQRPLIDKLGIQRGHRVLLVDVEETDPIRDAATERGAELVSAAADRDLDGVLFRVGDAEVLFERFREYMNAIRKNGMIWALWPKGGELRRDEIRRIGLAAGLVDVKVCSYSEELSGLKFVIPVENRRA